MESKNKKVPGVHKDLPSTFPNAISLKGIIMYTFITFAPIVFSIYQGIVDNMWLCLVVFFGGFIFWTLMEYIIHRFIFHPWELKKLNRPVPKILFVTHGLHHKHPTELETGFLKLSISIPVLLVFFSISYLIFRAYSYPFTSGFVLGYVTYVIFHYVMHHYKPPFFWLNRLWKHHHFHHFKNTHKAYGVTNTFWDLIFGTLPLRRNQ